MIAESIENWIGRVETWAIGAAGTLVVIVLILIVARLTQAVLAAITRRLLRPRDGAKDHAAKLLRTQTLLPLILEVERYVVYFVAIFAILRQLGVDTTAIFASLGVIGLALGLGAQNLIKDVISGFFLLFDGLIAVGDIVRLDDRISGTVEVVGLRNTHIREFGGMLWVVPNEQLRRFGNLNRGWGRAVVEVEIAHESDLQAAMRILREEGERWARENEAKVLEAPEVAALLGLQPSGLSLRLSIKVRALQQAGAEREIRMRVKERFDAEGVELATPKRVVIERRMGGGSSGGEEMEAAAGKRSNG